MKTCIKIFSLLLTICILFSAINIPVSADNSKYKKYGISLSYGKYFGTSDEDYLWIYKNKTFKHKWPHSTTTGKWEVQASELGVYLCIYIGKSKIPYCTFNLDKGKDKLELSTMDGLGASNIYYKCPSKPSKVKLSKKKNYVKVSWKKVSWKIAPTGSVGYEIQYSTNKKFKNKKIVRVYSGSTTSKKIYDLKKNKKYYFRVRSFLINEKVYCYATKDFSSGSVFSYNDFSSVKSIKTPKSCKTVKTISKTKAKEKAFKKFKSDYGKNITKTKKYITKTKLHGKQYYIFMFEYYFHTQTGNGLLPHYRQPYYIVSLDGQEIKKVELDIKMNYSKNKYYDLVLF